MNIVDDPFFLTFARMFDGLRKKWKVNGLQLTLILCTFAIGGSATGYAARKLITLFAIEQRWLWIIIYILLVTLIWPVAVYLISFPFGQSRFFTKYLQKIGKRMFGRRSAPEKRHIDLKSELPATNYQPPTKIAIFASGAGSNAKKIIEYFKNSSSVRVALIVCNKPGAGVLSIAANENIPTILIEKDRFFYGDAYIDELNKYKIDFIVLAGFLWKVPPNLIMAYRNKIINIHPALLPSYGGKGMYGNKVHEAVITAKEKESGISIHFVDDIYDHGTTIFQATCPVLETDTADSLAQRIHQLEHQYYPKVIEQLLNSK
jgi:formyltetrahydrofolate-dependent phosphoribosylglycinamide formyltransferase